MKATGIVRRIDDLGRVVVPKEIEAHPAFAGRNAVGDLHGPRGGDHSEEVLSDDGVKRVCGAVCRCDGAVDRAYGVYYGPGSGGRGGRRGEKGFFPETHQPGAGACDPGADDGTGRKGRTGIYSGDG